MSNRRRSDATPQLSPRRPQRLPPGSPLVTLAVCARVTISSHTSCSYPPVRLTRRHRAPAKLRSPCLLHLPPILAPLNVQLVLESPLFTRLACGVCGSLGVCLSWSCQAGDYG
ncbi:hypothetical protein GQ55_5G086700 [Panicum hallii var. hallii]|uniref:Uncharacterized protein n=1 Tax=Panicum hallii var. hallii TaxID=1504633 RepID=A0A2T7DE65_9POAL|nr:hypothetical protein GQ55_5G086700 [Panicum hallii var. hallii]